MIAFLDSCAVIYWLEGSASWRGRVQAALTSSKARSLALSALSRMECRVKPLREGDSSLLVRYAQYFSQDAVNWVALDDRVIELATQVRAASGLKVLDALQAACALSLGPELRFITGDERFKRVPGLSTLVLR